MTIFIGDALSWLQRLPSESVHCIVTSPPYYGLRDYGVDGQLGLEATPDAYIDNMVAVFRAARRVLRADGTLWLNIGDTYSSGSYPSPKHASDNIGNVSRRNIAGLGSKQLLMIPHRLAIALQADGWWVRSDIVWAKPNPMPESVTDRPTKSKEYVFLLSKSERYYYDADAIREGYSKEYTTPASFGGFGNRKETKYSSIGNFAQGENSTPNPELGRNKRDVWTIPTKGFKEAHFATMPTELAETCIKAGCPATVCTECGAGYVAVVEATGGTIGKGWTDHSADLVIGMNGAGGSLSVRKDENGNPYTRHHKGYEPACNCNAATDSGIVLDPFGGAGTTAIAAIHLGRKYQLIELSIEYAGMAQQRIMNYKPSQHTTLPDGSRQLSLFADSA